MSSRIAARPRGNPVISLEPAWRSDMAPAPACKVFYKQRLRDCKHAESYIVFSHSQIRREKMPSLTIARPMSSAERGPATFSSVSLGPGAPSDTSGANGEVCLSRTGYRIQFTG